jgi:hypothetical protein
LNWISALGPLGWTLLLLVPPLILLLYFLKLRRTALEVPSTYLWTRTIEDLHVNSIWQRLRNSLLLVLQLLLALLLILACLRPGCEGEELSGERFIFLIDNSASMSAIDGDDSGNSRLDEAKKQVGNLIDRMKKGDAGMLISFSDGSDVLQSYTLNKSLLKRKLADMKPTQRGSDMNEALIAASGLANPGRTSDKTSAVDIQVADAKPAKLYIYSDGAVAPMPGYSFGDSLSLEYHPIGSFDPPNNVGITAFSISDQLESGNEVQAFARLFNSDDEDHLVDVSLYIADELFDAQRNIEVPKYGSKSLQYGLNGIVANLESAIPIRLEIETKDIYPQDNVALAVLNPPRTGKVLLVREYNQFLDFAVETSLAKKLAKAEIQPPAFLKEKKYEEAAALGVYDLIIYDECVPETMPLCNTMFIGKLPPDSNWSAADSASPTAIIDADLSHPIMNAVTLGDVTIIESTVIKGPSGWVPLVESADGPIMGIGPRGSFQDLVLGFAIVDVDQSGAPQINTDWPHKLSFPIFMQNVVTRLAGASRFDESSAISPGQLVTIKPQLPYPSIEVRSPRKEEVQLRPRKDNSFVYANTETSGIYSVIEPETKTIDQMFAVNLLDRRESDLRVKQELDVGFEAIQGTSADYKPARREYWPWIVGLALVVLSIEWYIYNRRVFI